MDKRSLIAIVLTFAVLLVWNAVFMAPKRRELARKRLEEQRLSARADSIDMSAREIPPEDTLRAEPEADEEAVAPAERWGLTAASGEEERVDIVVLTEKLRVTLDSRGGEIRSVELLDFVRKDGGLVELVPEGARGGMSLALTEGEVRTSLSDVHFEALIDGEPAGGRVEIELGDSRESAEILFRRAGPAGGVLEKRFLFNSEGYEIGLGIGIKREGELRRAEAYALGWECGMAVTEVDERGDTRQFAALGRLGDEFYKESMSKFSKEEAKLNEGMLVWAGCRTKYFLSAILPERKRSAKLSLLGSKERKFIGYSVEYPFRGDPRSIEESYVCYLGPLDMDNLKGYEVGLEKTIDLGRLRFFSVFILRLMIGMKRFIPNYGLVIIILSVLTKILFYRLTHKSFKSMKDMQKIQPRINELKEKYKDDKEKMNKETMRLYKEAGVNPLGGCLPLLLQMPVFIALFNVLRNTIELRGAPFALWISDLSSPDVLFKFGVSIPFIGSEFHLLPILMGAAMVLQSRLTGSPTGEAAPGQTKMMSTMMPIVFTFIFYGMPSGLVLYWLINNVFSIIQQYYIHKEVVEEGTEMIEASAEGGAQPEEISVARAADQKGQRKKSGHGKRGGGRSRKRKRRT